MYANILKCGTIESELEDALRSPVSAIQTHLQSASHAYAIQTTAMFRMKHRDATFQKHPIETVYLEKMSK